MQDYIQVLAYRERISVKRVRKLGVARATKSTAINIRAVASSLHIKLCFARFYVKNAPCVISAIYDMVQLYLSSGQFLWYIVLSSMPLTLSRCTAYDIVYS